MSLRSMVVILALGFSLAGCAMSVGDSGESERPTITPTAGPGGSAALGSIQISEAWARVAGATQAMAGHGTSQPTPSTMEAPSSGPNGAVYMTIRNTGSAGDRLLQAESFVAGAVELHTTVKEGDVMKMRPVQGGIEIPAGGEARLEPGGYHVMLIGVTKELIAGDQIDLKLHFEQAGEINLQAPVRQP